MRDWLTVVEEYKDDEFDIVMRYCEHVKLVNQQILPVIYLDPYTNTINSESEYIYFKGYDINLDLFKRSQRELFRQGVRLIRSKK